MSWYERQVKSDEERSGNVKMSGIFDVTAGKVLVNALSGSGSAATGGMLNNELAILGVAGSAGLLFKYEDTVYQVSATEVE